MQIMAITASTALVSALLVSPADAATAKGVDGVWRLDGYGQILAIGGDRIQSYDVTTVSCLRGGVSGRRLGTDPGGAVRFSADGMPALTVRAGKKGRATLHWLGAAGDQRLRRLKALPARCRRPTPKDPRTVFDVFWATYAENYAFFKARKVDWKAQRARYRPQVTARTTDKQLFAILSDMIKPLGDAHTKIEWDDDHRFSGHRPGTRHATLGLKNRTDQAVARHLGVPIRTWGDGFISYADLPGGIGYLRLTSFLLWAGEDYSFDTHRRVLDQALDSVLTTSSTRRLKGLIVDVRLNVGGYDGLGLRLASRLTGRPYTAYVKKARNDPRDRTKFTPAQTITVRPAAKPRYTGPIALLASDLTNSAGETYTQAMLDRTPRPTLIGMNTQGIFSDIMETRLPNGWTIGLTNEDYRTAKGRSFEGPGIPPDIRTPVFTEAELTTGRDSAVDQARALLTKP